MRMLPQDDLVHTSALDQAAWNYSGMLGAISRRRLALARTLLGTAPLGETLEIGYGSGVFMPSWDEAGGRLHGVDVHDHPGDVAAALARHGIVADLRTGSVTALPFPDASMDTVIGISVLEFVDDLPSACTEIRRVLRPGGRLCVVTPGHSRVLDLGLRLLSSERAEDTFQGRRQRVIPALEAVFRIVRRQHFPALAPPPLRMYTGLLLE